MSRSRILAAATVGALIALGPASAASADVGPIDETGGHVPGPSAQKRTPEGKVKIQKAPRSTKTPATPKGPAPKPFAPKPVAPKPAPKPVAPKQDFSIGEATFYAQGVAVVAPKPAIDAGRVSAKGKPAKPPVVVDKGKVATKSTTTAPRTTVTKVPSKPEGSVVKLGQPGRTGGQLPAGAPRTGFGASAGEGLDTVAIGAGSAAALAGLALLGFGMARRRQVVAFCR